MEVKVFSTSNQELPQYATPQSAGLDLRANIEQPITIQPHKRTMIPTGLHIELPVGYEAHIRPRSGLALRNGLVAVLGTIDADYRGDIGVILINHNDEPFVVHNGDRIAQMVLSQYTQIEFEPVDSMEELDKTERGTGGFGHSGVK